LVKFPENVTEKELLEKVKEFNDDADINGYIVQFPLPEHINSTRILNAIHPKKDVD
jgi:methylenetetrahydrofolate dehydrogenase (NADP+)/methenyltetrahydrofolate cyclohydrolase